MKKLITPSRLCKGLSHQLGDFIRKASRMKFTEDPDYKGLRALLVSMLETNEHHEVEYD